MNNLTIEVRLDHRFGTNRTAVRIAEPYIEAFKPIDVCDDPWGRLLSNDNPVTIGSFEMDRVLKMREYFAKDLAGKLTEALIEQMSKNDLTNGYSNNELL